MGNRPRLLDLFCGAGGCSVGYARAGFEVVGIDIKPQPRYPFRFHRGDALEFLAANGGDFDAIHASPPCQRFSRRGRNRTAHADLIGPCRNLFVLTGLPWVIENVPGSPLVNPCVLRGTMFGLGVIRDRWFESSFNLVPPADLAPDAKIGEGYFTVTGNTGGKACKKTGNRKVSGGTAEEWRKAMGIDWMPVSSLVQAIPPAYTEFIGRQLLSRL